MFYDSGNLFPPTFVSTPGEHVSGPQAFLESVNKSLHLNSNIPPKDPSHLRLMTYNVHYFHDSLHNNNEERVYEDVAITNADVVVFQEMPYSLTKSVYEIYDSRMGYLGYPFVVRCFAERFMELGNVLYSKFPITDVESRLMKTGKRCFVSAVVQLPSARLIRVLGTHLEVNRAQNRIEEMIEILHFLKSKGELVPSVILGDFNEHRDQGAHKIAIDSGFFDPFTLQKELPQFTCWTGTVIDFVLVQKDLRKFVKGSYVYQTASSDHLPVIVDLAF